MLEAHAREVAQIVKACMEGACSLSVPLVAHPCSGTKWGSMVPVEDNKNQVQKAEQRRPAAAAFYAGAATATASKRSGVNA